MSARKGNTGGDEKVGHGARTYGIDLGTTCSAIGVVEDGRPRVLPVDGAPLVPSVVSFPREGPPLVGTPAWNRLALEPERTIRSAKRWMGTDSSWEIDGRTLSPIEVSARILGRLADAVLEQEGARPERVVITVPAWFTQAQRKDTRSAAKRAGLEAVRLINEPTAAALAHAHKNDVRRRALVYDLGGGTFDASLVEQHGDLVEVRASHGDTHLGGDDLDQALVELLLERLRTADPELGAAVRASVAALTRLSIAAREAKHTLSSELEAEVRVPFLIEHAGRAHHLEDKLTRDELEGAFAPLFARTLASVEHVLRDAQLEPGDVEELLLVGGSTRIPFVWEGLRRRYGWEGSAAVPPEEAVVLGAAIQAALIDGSRVDGVLVDVAPYSLSVGTLVTVEPPRMVAQVVTPRNAPLPARHSMLFHTAGPTQEIIQIPIFQGADPNPLRNVMLGRIAMDKLPPAPPGLPHGRPIGVQFEHDLDGVVSVRVTDQLSGRSENLRLAADGAEEIALRRLFTQELKKNGILLGDGNDPDPFLEREDARARRSARRLPVFELAADEPADAPSQGDMDEARAAFERTVAKGAAIEREHGAHGRALIELARRGLEALKRGEAGAVTRAYDELADGLFGLGIYF